MKKYKAKAHRRLSKSYDEVAIIKPTFRRWLQFFKNNDCLGGKENVFELVI